MQNSSLCAVFFYSCWTNHEQTEHDIQWDLWILVLNHALIEIVLSGILFSPSRPCFEPVTCSIYIDIIGVNCVGDVWSAIMRCTVSLYNKPPYKYKKIHKHRGREWLWGMKQCPWFLKHCWKFWYVGECAPSPSLFIFQTCCKWVTVLKR